ncbi:MAG: hypothetical protein LBS52_08555 [Dysgonamonadaceae bacterium]|jgi:ketopantoate reductase|nr:hypothetical protein [Dysgonamonadaceae bacterium]
MDCNKLTELINRYWAGDTTPEEEREIRLAFALHDALPPEAEQWRRWFEGETAIGEAVGEEFDKKVLEKIDGKGVLDTLFQSRTRPLWQKLAAAACIAALLTISLKVFVPQHTAPPDTDEMSLAEAQEAFEALKSALYFASSEINRAEKTTQTQFKTLNSMNSIIKIN